MVEMLENVVRGVYTGLRSDRVYVRQRVDALHQKTMDCITPRQQKKFWENKKTMGSPSPFTSVVILYAPTKRILINHPALVRSMHLV